MKSNCATTLNVLRKRWLTSARSWRLSATTRRSLRESVMGPARSWPMPPKSLTRTKPNRLATAVSDAQRTKNMERSSRDAAVRQQTLATAQRKVERIMRATAEGYREAFKGSGLEFDQDVETSDEEDRQSAPLDVVTDTPQPPLCRSERSGSNDSSG